MLPLNTGITNKNDKELRNFKKCEDESDWVEPNLPEALK